MRKFKKLDKIIVCAIICAMTLSTGIVCLANGDHYFGVSVSNTSSRWYSGLSVDGTRVYLSYSGGSAQGYTYSPNKVVIAEDWGAGMYMNGTVFSVSPSSANVEVSRAQNSPNYAVEFVNNYSGNWYIPSAHFYSR